MGSHDENQDEQLTSSEQFSADRTEQHHACVRHAHHRRMLELELADDVASVSSDYAHAYDQYEAAKHFGQ